MKYTRKGEKFDKTILIWEFTAIDWQVRHICVLSDVSPHLFGVVANDGSATRKPVVFVDGDNRAC